MARVNIPIQLPDGQEGTLLQEAAEQLGWKEETQVTAQKFLSEMFASQIKGALRTKRINDAVALAKQQKAQEVDQIIIK